jgi:hypothetical protein
MHETLSSSPDSMKKEKKRQQNKTKNPLKTVGKLNLCTIEDM